MTITGLGERQPTQTFTARSGLPERARLNPSAEETAQKIEDTSRTLRGVSHQLNHLSQKLDKAKEEAERLENDVQALKNLANSMALLSAAATIAFVVGQILEN